MDPQVEHTFVVGGQRITLSRTKVESVLRSVNPEPIRKYYIVFEGKRYPLKQIVAVATGKPRVGFTVKNAYRILTKLGFDVKEY